MEIKLAESIRTFRKERSLTQEQLAEVLGVTVGAVYKWEAGLSTPELPLIVEMADFFDTSIDVLLGYILKDNRIDATARRLRHCQRVKDLNGLEEAEKALKKYPNSFIIVYRSAMLYQALGLYKRDNAKLRRDPADAKKRAGFPAPALRRLPLGPDQRRRHHRGRLPDPAVYPHPKAVLLCRGAVPDADLFAAFNAGSHCVVDAAFCRVDGGREQALGCRLPGLGP